MTGPQLFTIPETATRLRCSRDHVYDLITRGELAATDIGCGRAKTRVSEAALAAYVAVRTRPARRMRAVS